MDRMKKSDVTAPAGVSGFLMALSSKGKYLMKNCDAVKRFFCLNGFFMIQNPPTRVGLRDDTCGTWQSMAKPGLYVRNASPSPHNCQKKPS